MKRIHGLSTSIRASTWAVMAAALALTVGLSGFAIAQSSTGGTQINACAKKKGGALRVAAKCRKTERKVKLATVGPAGAAGTAGAVGTPGTNGSNGTNGNTTGETFYDENLSVGANFGGGACGATPFGGPSVTFTAPAGAYVQIMAQADMQRTGATSNTVCLQVDGGAAQTIMSSVSLAYETRYLSQSAGSGGATTAYTITPFSFPVSAGSHTINLLYSSTGGTSNFRNRKLWVTMFRPTT
ncbi:MAG TPA: hypothetical protein VNT22_11035 [Baekduia sp.]|nr:hypothetical protein [Baekduia sp.]